MSISLYVNLRFLLFGIIYLACIDKKYAAIKNVFTWNTFFHFFYNLCHWVKIINCVSMKYTYRYWIKVRYLHHYVMYIKKYINLTFIKHDKLIVDSSNKTEICRGLVYCKSLTPTFNRSMQLATDVCSMLYTLHNEHFIGRITINLYFFTKKENSLATQTPIITVRLSIVTANWIPFISTRAPITIRF